MNVIPITTHVSLNIVKKTTVWVKKSGTLKLNAYIFWNILNIKIIFTPLDRKFNWLFSDMNIFLFNKSSFWKNHVFLVFISAYILNGRLAPRINRHLWNIKEMIVKFLISLLLSLVKVFFIIWRFCYFSLLRLFD